MFDKKVLIINAVREDYATDQIRKTMTVGELIDFLNDYDKDTLVYLGHDIKSFWADWLKNSDMTINK